MRCVRASQRRSWHVMSCREARFKLFPFETRAKDRLFWYRDASPSSGKTSRALLCRRGCYQVLSVATTSDSPLQKESASLPDLIDCLCPKELLSCCTACYCFDRDVSDGKRRKGELGTPWSTKRKKAKVKKAVKVGILGASDDEDEWVRREVEDNRGATEGRVFANRRDRNDDYRKPATR